MSTRSYVGVLDPDGRTYRARYVHFDGDPNTMPYLIAAVWWHTFNRDSTATVQALLAHNWEQIGPEITVATAPSLPGYRPVAGVGIAFPPEQCPPQPVTAALTDPPSTTVAQWMYLLDAAHPDTLLICTNTAGRWSVTGRLNLAIGRDVAVDPD